MKNCLFTFCFLFLLALASSAQKNGEALNFMFSPNPVKNKCFLEVNQTVDLVVLDLRGEVVLRKKMFTSGEIDMSLVAEGIYFLQLSTAEQVKTQRLVKSSFH